MRRCPGVSVWLEPAFPTGRSWSAAGTHPPAPLSMPQFTGSLVRYPARVSFVAYVVAVLLGGFLLTLPACRQPGRPPVSFVDGAFTATSACCVTGLTVRSTLNDFSFLGQALILALIQLGGLGIMTITTLVSFHNGGQATLHQRAVIAETLGIRSGRDLRWVTFGVLVTVLSADVAYRVMRSRMRRRAALTPVSGPAFADPTNLDPAAAAAAATADADQLVAAAR